MNPAGRLRGHGNMRADRGQVDWTGRPEGHRPPAAKHLSTVLSLGCNLSGRRDQVRQRRAARGDGAAIEVAGARISRQRLAGCLYDHSCFCAQRLERGGLCREAKSSD